MTPVHVNTDIRVSGGYSEYLIDSERDLEVTFRFREDADVFVRISACRNLRIRAFADSGVKAALLFWNDSAAALNADESYEVMKDAALTVAYCECNEGETKRRTNAVLRESGAYALISTASLVNSSKHYDIMVVNDAPHTAGEMKNYAVVLKEGRLMIDAVGKIIKGAYGSTSHQTSRAMSFEEGQKTTILPELLIDENDVQASHAMSIGRIDEDILYYMMSRGMNMQQCTSLISAGYLMPVTEVIENDELKEKLRGELERKMADLCSM